MIENSICLVTGGAGTIGSTIVDQLVDAGAAEVRVLDNFVRGRKENLAAALPSGRVRVVDGDVRDVATVRDVTAGADLVFHQAAIRITQCAEEPRLALEVLADGTFNVLEAAVEAGVRKVVAASSASVYGLATEFPTTETQHPWDNDTFYGAAKVFNEGMLRSFHAMSGLDYVALRYFNVYGPRMDIHGLYTEVLIRWMERIEAQALVLGRRLLGATRETVPGLALTLALSRHTPEPERLGVALDEARLALSIGERLGRIGEVVTFEETGTYKLLFQIFADRPEELTAFYDQTIAPLVRYDEQYQTELVGTLSTYLGHDCNLAATASTLYTHRHTVRYRLDRIAELSGLDIAKTDDREKLSLGLKAMRLLGRRVATPAERTGRRRAAS